jgi:hypothetical protein
MATNSIIHSVFIQQKELARKFVDALEHAQEKKTNDVIINRAVNDLTVEQIRALFSK